MAPNRTDRRRSVLIAGLAVLVVLTLAAWWYVAGMPSGQTCKMPATPICTDLPHEAAVEDWALAVIAVALTLGLGWTVRRGRRT